MSALLPRTRGQLPFDPKSSKTRRTPGQVTRASHACMRVVEYFERLERLSPSSTAQARPGQWPQTQCMSRR